MLERCKEHVFAEAEGRDFKVEMVNQSLQKNNVTTPSPSATKNEMIFSFSDLQVVRCVMPKKSYIKYG